MPRAFHSDNSLHFIQIPFKCTSIESSLNAPFDIFWVGIDQVNRWTNNRENCNSQMARVTLYLQFAGKRHTWSSRTQKQNCRAVRDLSKLQVSLKSVGKWPRNLNILPEFHSFGDEIGSARQPSGKEGRQGIYWSCLLRAFHFIFSFPSVFTFNRKWKAHVATLCIPLTKFTHFGRKFQQKFDAPKLLIGWNESKSRNNMTKQAEQRRRMLAEREKSSEQVQEKMNDRFIDSVPCTAGKQTKVSQNKMEMIRRVNKRFNQFLNGAELRGVTPPIRTGMRSKWKFAIFYGFIQTTVTWPLVWLQVPPVGLGHTSHGHVTIRSVNLLVADDSRDFWWTANWWNLHLTSSKLSLRLITHDGPNQRRRRRRRKSLSLSLERAKNPIQKKR